MERDNEKKEGKKKVIPRWLNISKNMGIQNNFSYVEFNTNVKI